MTKLNQILAIEGGVKTKTDKAGAELLRQVQKDALVNGISRVYTPKDDDGDKLPSESTMVQVKVPDVLDKLADLMTRLFDVVLTKETSNTDANAPIIVDGVELLPAVPVTYLLFLGHQLDELASVVDKLPTLDPASTWTWDANSGVYITQPVETTKTKKVPKVLVAYEATKEHPAQLQIYNEDVNVGTWATVKSSGAIFGTRKAELAERVDKLRAAVKTAREAANMLDVTDRQAGEAIFTWLFRTG